MGILNRFRKDVPPKPTAGSAGGVKRVVKKSDEKKEEAAAVVTHFSNNTRVQPWMFRLLGRPHTSEKATRLAEKNGVYTFDVPMDAEKRAIRRAIENFYGVKVTDVRTLRHAGKVVRRGKRLGARNAWKKALVTLKKGQTMDPYSPTASAK
jgi:large subunit ribosomal protein L23